MTCETPCLVSFENRDVRFSWKRDDGVTASSRAFHLIVHRCIENILLFAIFDDRNEYRAIRGLSDT